MQTLRNLSTLLVRIAPSPLVTHRKCPRLVALVRHRRLVRQLIGTELRSRYTGSALGPLWSLLHPVVLVAIYVLVFSEIIGSRLQERAGPFEYSVYLCAGLLPWMAFQEILTRSTTVFVDRSDLVRQVAFPKAALHASVVGVATVNLALLLAALFAFLAVTGRPIAPTVAFWPFLLTLQLLFAAGLGFVASVLHVYFRDTAHVVAVALQLWFWLTPIVYTVSVLPAEATTLLSANPMFWFVQAHHGLLLDGDVPEPLAVVRLVTVAAASLVAGLLVLAAFEHRLADEV